MTFNKPLVLCLLFVMGLAGCLTIGDSFSNFDDAETWAFQPFYGELRFLILEAGSDMPIPDAALAVSELRIEELAGGDETISSDQDGLIVIH